MAIPLSSLTDNLAKWLQKGKCENVSPVLSIQQSLTSKCVGCNKICEKEFDASLTKRFKNTDWFCDGDINSVLLHVST